MNLKSYQARLRDRRIGLGVIERGHTIDPTADALSFTNNTVVIPLAPSDSVAGKPLVIDFYLPGAASPKSIGVSTNDERLIGVGLQTAVFE